MDAKNSAAGDADFGQPALVSGGACARSTDKETAARADERDGQRDNSRACQEARRRIHSSCRRSLFVSLLPFDHFNPCLSRGQASSQLPLALTQSLPGFSCRAPSSKRALSVKVAAVKGVATRERSGHLAAAP